MTYLKRFIFFILISTIVTGKSNYSLSFDGINDYVQGNSSNFPFGDEPRTIGAWIKSSSQSMYDRCIVMYGENGRGAPKNFHLVILGDHRLAMGNGFGYGMVEGISNIDDDQWHYVTGVYEGNTTNVIRLYVDGIFDGYGAPSYVPNTLAGANKYNFCTCLNQSPGEFFDGIVDEIRIWNRALSQEEIVEHLYTSVPDSDLGLVGYWTFNEGIGDTIFDYSNNTNHGTIHGAEWVSSGVPILELSKSTPDLIPVVFSLSQNYPNPFNPITTIRYDLPEQSQVLINIYDILGREVITLVNTTQDAGYKSVIWDGTDEFGRSVGTGIYLYQIKAGDLTQTRKMILLR